jgi:hypothetical protein
MAQLHLKLTLQLQYERAAVQNQGLNIVCRPYYLLLSISLMKVVKGA